MPFSYKILLVDYFTVQYTFYSILVALYSYMFPCLRKISSTWTLHFQKCANNRDLIKGTRKVLQGFFTIIIIVFQISYVIAYNFSSFTLLFLLQVMSAWRVRPPYRF